MSWASSGETPTRSSQLRSSSRTAGSASSCDGTRRSSNSAAVDSSRTAWKACSTSLDAGDPLDSTGRVTLSDRALDHVFTLLGLALDPEAVELARRALSTSDARLRGTALEYLEHVVPEPIRSGIWPYLQAGRAPGQAHRRTAAEAIEELSKSFG